MDHRIEPGSIRRNLPPRDFFSRNVFRLERIRRPRTIGIGISFRGEKEGKEGEVGKSNKVETIPRIFVPFPDGGR